jgi:hypothetical protein
LSFGCPEKENVRIVLELVPAVAAGSHVEIQEGPPTPQPRSLAEPFSARQALLRGFCRLAKQAKPLRDMKRVAHGRPPYDVNPTWRGPLAAKKVDSEPLPQRSHHPTASSTDRVRKGPVGISVLMMMLQQGLLYEAALDREYGGGRGRPFIAFKAGGLPPPSLGRRTTGPDFDKPSRKISLLLRTPPRRFQLFC